MESLTLEKLNSLFSEARIVTYVDKNDTPEMVLEKYHMNIALSEAMLPSLHYFEILLRNRLDSVIKQHYGDNWLLSPPAILKISDQDVKKIADIVHRQGIHSLHNRVLSQLTFGFWSAFFHKKYDPLLWHQKGALKSVFPFLSKRNRKRSYIEQKVLKIKVIRNRIAHHEPVWNHKVSIDEVHTACYELIRAMSPEALQLLFSIDRFPIVYEMRLHEKTTHLNFKKLVEQI